MAKTGDYELPIVAHGTDTSRSGLPFAWFTVKFPNGEEGTANVFLASDKGEEKDATTKRMARATLKLCGFDPDTQEVDDLNLADILVGNVVPVTVSQNGQYTNFDIQRPRGIKPDVLKNLTAALRACKSDKEDSMPAPKRESAAAAPSAASSGGFQDMTQSEKDAAKKAVARESDNWQDIPFSFLAAMLCIVGGALFA